MRSYNFLHFKPYFSVCNSFRNYMPRRTAVDLAHTIYGSGSGVPIIVMHGMLGSQRNWRSIAQNLAKELDTKVITVDLRNHGDSPHALPHTYPELALDIAQFISKVGFEKVNLIGHSMGGRTAMVLALTQDNVVDSLVVVDISPITTSTSLSGYIPKVISVMQSLNFQNVKLEEAAKMTANKMIKLGLAQKPEDAHFLKVNLVLKSDNTVGWKCNVDGLSAHLRDISSFPSEIMSKQFQGNTMFIGGKDSNFIPPEDLPHIQKMFPKAKLKYIEGAGHNVHYDAGRTFLNIVIAFLKVGAFPLGYRLLIFPVTFCIISTISTAYGVKRGIELWFLKMRMKPQESASYEICAKLTIWGHNLLDK